MTREKNTGLYQTIYDSIQNQECLLCTVVEGPYQGEKLLFCGGERVWCREGNSFLPSIEETLLEVPGSKVIEAGENSIFCEHFGDRSRLVICGAGHVAIPVIELGKKLRFHVTVLEDRPLFANHARSAGADEVLCDSFEQGMKKIAGSNGTYFVIVTRGHRYDRFCLEQALKKENAYIGMMGSRKRVALVKEQLAQKGVPQSLLEQVHTPIGLSIGAETPEEIAISILAEIIQVKNSRRRTAGYVGEILDALLASEAPILATIVSRKGSAPREMGTKMLIYQDGRTVGTIGGGCMESEVVQKARRMLKGMESPHQLLTLDMTGKEAEEEGMVCGGVVEVYLERSGEAYEKEAGDCPGRW